MSSAESQLPGYVTLACYGGARRLASHVEMSETARLNCRLAVTIGVGIGHRLGVSADLAATVGYALLIPYLVLALKRVYSEPIGGTL